MAGEESYDEVRSSGAMSFLPRLTINILFDSLFSLDVMLRHRSTLGSIYLTRISLLTSLTIEQYRLANGFEFHFALGSQRCEKIPQPHDRSGQRLPLHPQLPRKCWFPRPDVQGVDLGLVEITYRHRPSPHA